MSLNPNTIISVSVLVCYVFSLLVRHILYTVSHNIVLFVILQAIDSRRDSVLVSLCFALSLLGRRALGTASHNNASAR